MPFRVEAAGDAAVIKLTPESLEDPTAASVGGLLLRLADEPGRHQLRLDLGELPYVNSEWLGKFIALHKKVKGAGGHLALVNVPPAVYEVFEVTHLHRVLDVRRKQAG